MRAWENHAMIQTTDEPYHNHAREPNRKRTAKYYPQISNRAKPSNRKFPHFFRTFSPNLSRHFFRKSNHYTEPNHQRKSKTIAKRKPNVTQLNLCDRKRRGYFTIIDHRAEPTPPRTLPNVALFSKSAFAHRSFSLDVEFLLLYSVFELSQMRAKSLSICYR